MKRNIKREKHRKIVSLANKEYMNNENAMLIEETETIFVRYKQTKNKRNRQRNKRGL